MTILSAVCLAAATGAPAFAVSDPLVVNLKPAAGQQGDGSATIFGSGASVLVNVTGGAKIPSGVALTLNDGTCANPGGVAFALSPFNDGSMTKLQHPLTDIAAKAKSLVIHRSASETSPPLACGEISG